MRDVKTISEAPESNAGDDFHVLWTLKRSFELLNFDDNGLKALYIEGVEQNLATKIDPTGEKFLGVDLLEYYGGEKFNEARKIIISQLKYSTRRINQNIIFSELYKGKKSGSSDGSIIHRLATIYKTFVDEFGETLVLKKVKIKLISNRVFNESQLKIITDSQNLLSTTKSITFEKLNKTIKVYNNSFNSIFKATKLSKKDFLSFIKLLDFSQCGVDSRNILEQELIKTICNTSVTSKNQFNSLYKLIWNKMMPESIGNSKITFIDIIANLGFNNGSIENLFPVIQSFEKLKNNIKREQLDEIIEKIGTNKSGLPICIHGVAGIGKSTITKQIENNLPSYSECIVFDCYGAGAYLDADDKRHLHKYALLQISNEIAKRLGTEFLILPNDSDEVYIKELKKRIVSALEILKSRNKNAFLTIIIDAADNSITAAQKNGEKSFVEDLLNINIPNSCNIIVTTRTYRKDTLGLPDEYMDVELHPFSKSESEQFLKYYYPKNSETEINEFHNLTGGIPRVQSYSMDLKSKGINEVINYLKPNGKKVEDIIEEKIIEATKKIGENGKKKIDDFFKYLITLPRPVPINYLQEASAMSEEFLNDLATDIWYGLICENNHFNFRDEDFENYIRDKYSASINELKIIAQLFIKKAENDEYASIGLGNILFIAEEKEKLKNIVLDRSYSTLPLDPIRNKEVYINRTKLAMKVSSSDDDNTTFFKLILIAAEESKTDKTLTNLLITYPDLVTQFGNESSLARLNLKSDEATWAGSFHLKLAGIYSRKNEEKQIAIRHLKTARNWLNWKHSSINKKEYHNYPISSLDIAYQTEAILRLFGVEEAISSINSWTPKSILISSGEYLAKNIILNSSNKQITLWAKYKNFRIDSQIFIVCKLFQFEKEIYFDLNSMAHSIHKILSKNRIKFKTSFKLLIVEFCEILAFNQKSSSEYIVDILNLTEFKKTTDIPSFNSKYDNDKNAKEMDLHLRIITLKSSLNNQNISIEDIYPKELIADDKTKNYEERSYLDRKKREFSSFFNYALPIYKLKGDRISFVLNDEECRKKIEETCSKIKNDWDFKYTNGYSSNERLFNISSLLLDITLLLENNENLIDIIINSFEEKTSKLGLRFIILEKISHLKRFHKIALKIINEIDSLIEKDTISAKEATEFYIDCTLSAVKVDKEIGKYYFDKAIKSVSDIDYEAFHQIICIKNLTEVGITKSDPELAYQYARFIEYCDIKLDYYDKKHFPYSSGLLGISNLDMASTYPIACRWHHREVIDIEKHIIIILKISLEKGYIDHTIASSLIPLYSYYHHTDDLVDLYKLIINKYDLEGCLERKSFFIKSIFRDFQIAKNSSMLEIIYKEIQNGKFLRQEIILEIRNYLDFREDLTEKKSDEYKNTFNSKKYQHNINLNNFDFISTKEIENAINEIINLNDDYDSKWAIDNLLFDIKEKCISSQYVSHLNCLVDIDTNLLAFDSFKSALKERLDEWDFHPLVKDWKKNKFKYVLLNWFQHFNDYNLSLWQVNEFAKMFSIDDDTLAETILNILPEKIEQLSDESIYSLIELIKNRLTIDENEKIIRWTLNRWTSKIKPEIADGNWNRNLVPTENSIETIGNTLRFILGHPDKRTRWRGIHSLRRLVNLDNVDVLKFLLDIQNERECFPFQNKEYLFYWMSSKLYLWIAIERISKEVPDKLIKFKDAFLNELLNVELPHVLIKYLIKNTCLNLHNYNNSTYSINELETITQVLKSKFEKVEEKRLSRHQRKYNSNSNGEWRFKFDTMDTLPYWYSHVGEWFNLSEYDVADIADKYIIEDWGYDGNSKKNDFIRKNLRDRDWYLLDNRHGNLPTIEDLKTYYEYHAMYCAANDLLEKEPMVVNDYIWNSWEIWLSSEANVWDDYWLSDFRDPLPLEKKYWINDNEIFDKNWRDNINEETFDEELGLINNLDANSISLYSSTRKFIGPNYETVAIRSALISIKGSEALLRSFQTASEKHDYAVPFENESDHFEIDSNGFVYKGWLKDIRSEREGLDSHDPFSSKICKDYVRFGDCVDELFNINYSNNFKEAYYDKNLIATYINWDEISDTEDNRRYGTGLESSAGILKVDTKFLLEFLTKKKKCLIVECRIDRQLEEKEYRNRHNQEEEENTEESNTKIYLIKPDGTVKTIRGRNYKIG
jgi:hypothetical protein